MRRYLPVLTASVLAAVLGSGCPGPNGTDQPAGPRTAGLRAFSSPDELKSYLADQAIAATGSNQTGEAGGLFSFLNALGSTATAPRASETNQTGASDTAASDPFSTTNVQEEGVDESDVVKNDGQTIYSLDDNKIHVTKGTPANGLQELATITIGQTGNSLYLQGTNLVVISQQYGYYGYWGYGYAGRGGVLLMKATTAGNATGGASVAPTPSMPVAPNGGAGDSSTFTVPDSNTPPFYGQPGTIVAVYDVSNPASPTLKGTANFQGALADTRLIGTKLHLVMAMAPQLPSNPTTANIQAMPLEDWIPKYQLLGADGTEAVSGPVAGWQSFYRPETPNGYGIVTVVTMDVDQPTQPVSTTAISANANIVYASPQSLYVTDTGYDSTTSQDNTIINKFAFTDAGTEYVASGLVPGHPLNQYSLGEFEGYLRIATNVTTYSGPNISSPVSSGSSGSATGTATSTAAQVAAPTQTNGVYVLGVNGASLDVVGKVEGIAPSEQLYSARFVGSRGFLVTFKKIDPLFTLDLSDPTQPRVAGELKTPGYSDHIQLLDANHLLTIGKDAVASTWGDFSWYQGVQLSIFDVTDAANPLLMHKEIIGTRGTSSEANYNPKAFNYYPARNALALPIDLFEGSSMGPNYGQHTFTGLYVYSVTLADGFNLLGRISTAPGEQVDGCYFGYYGYTRGVFLGDDVYAVTQRGVKSAAIVDPATLLGDLTFTGATNPADVCFVGQPTAVFVGGGVQ
jgi:inhibitor of cysteine peptidase